MGTPKTGTGEKVQLIPSNSGRRTWTAPPKALQSEVVPNELFYVRNHWQDVPALDIATYHLVVDGEVDRPLTLTFDDVLQMPKKDLSVTLECCGNGPVPEYWTKKNRNVMERSTGHGLLGTASWAGVSVAEVLNRAGVRSTAVDVLFEGADHGPDEVAADPPDVTYERSVPLEKAMHPDTLLAYEMNSEPLPPIHGFPLRLVVPGWYGMTSIKWLVGIHVLDHEFKGFYQMERYMTVNGPGAETYYTYHTKMKVKSIITSPTPEEVIPMGTCLVTGAAWSGEEDVVKVELSADGGKTWGEARLKPRTDYSWYRWEYTWQTPAPGKYVLMSRATNEKGVTQPMDFPNKWDGIGYGNNMVFEHPVEVRNT